MKNFVELEAVLVRNKITKKKLALVCAHEASALLAVDNVAKRGYIEPILIGDKKEIETLMVDSELHTAYTIIDQQDPVKAAQIAVEMARKGEVELIMKGFIQTSDLLKAVVNKETGIREQKVLSHVALTEIPHRNAMYFVSDGGMIPYPTYEQKIGIIENTISVAHAIGIEVPKVALLDAAEHTNQRIPSSFESEKLAQLEWEKAILEGPISLDLAISKEAVDVKQYKGKIQGDANILIVPDIISGNILGKAGTLLTDGKMAGIIQGAKVPIILTSRGSMEDEKINSILLSCFIAERNKKI